MEIQKLKISEEERKLVSDFIGEDIGNEIDFNRLMPVVEKIESMEYKNGFNFCFDIVSRSAVEITAEDDSIVFIPNLGIGITSDAKKKNIYKAVVKFIQWYNQQKQTQ